MKKIIASILLFTTLGGILCSCGMTEKTATDTTDKVTVAASEPAESGADTVEYFDMYEDETISAASPEATDEGYNSVFQMHYMSMNCENIMQEEIGMPFGCEVVSLAITLKYFGHDISPNMLFRGFMPNDVYGKANPYYQYVGDPTDDTGYGCYAPCVVTTANEYLTRQKSPRRAKDVSGSSMYELLGYVWNGIPVIIWGTLNMSPTSKVADSWMFNGERVTWYSLSHCVVICGVQDDDFIICDPMVGKVKYPIKDVEAAYKLINSQAVVIY